MNPAFWADIRRDLDAAARYVHAASRRARSLADGAAVLDPDIREDREAAIGLLIHNCYGAMESALERIVQAIDGGLPTGPAYHADLVRRAGTAVEGVRPAVIAAGTAQALQRLRSFRHIFRHAYDGYDYARAVENVAVAEDAVPAFRRDVSEFARKIGIAPQDGGPD
ncbi:hypothetical protein [Arenibaculum sp.]|uniref:ribonuclease toxin HepT-like protein n=1 Tax=Arenibaculum sp. TaxID=2865862 RepID=UPI002E166F22|nr:hypothetical protein [Arenibaculum sp.]